MVMHHTVRHCFKLLWELNVAMAFCIIFRVNGAARLTGLWLDNLFNPFIYSLILLLSQGLTKSALR